MANMKLLYKHILKYKLINTINSHRRNSQKRVLDISTQQNTLFIEYINGKVLDFDFTQEPPPQWFREHKFREDVINLAKLYIKINK